MLSKGNCIKKGCFFICLLCTICIWGCSDKNSSSIENENKKEPQSPADEVHDENDVEIKDPSDAPVMEEIEGLKDVRGQQVLELLSEYGFSDTGGVDAPDGSASWVLQNGNYTCDIQADGNGNVYNAVFTDSGDDYADFLSKCAGTFGSDAAAWVTENVNGNTTAEIGGFSVSISEGPGGHSLQVCSLEYKNMVVGPKDADGPEDPQNPE